MIMPPAPFFLLLCWYLPAQILGFPVQLVGLLALPYLGVRWFVDGKSAGKDIEEAVVSYMQPAVLGLPWADTTHQHAVLGQVYQATTIVDTMMRGAGLVGSWVVSAQDSIAGAALSA
jgi:hypothetical protein